MPSRPDSAPSPQIGAAAMRTGAQHRGLEHRVPRPASLILLLLTLAALLACSDEATPDRLATEAVRSEFNTKSDVTQGQQRALDGILDDATGKDVTIVIDYVEIEPGHEQGIFRLTVPVAGLDAGDDVSGADAELNLGNVTINAPDSAGDRAVTIVLDETLTMRGEAGLVSRQGELEVVVQELTLHLRPEAPNPGALTGGAEDVTEIGVELEVEVTSLPAEDAALEVRYSKALEAFVQDSTAVLNRVASRVRENGVIEDPSEDVAFSVQVTRVNLERESLGDSIVRLQVSSGWYESRVADGKMVTVVKQGDEGGSYLPGDVEVREVPGEALHEVIASFTGESGGFSTFTLIAVASSAPAAATPNQSAIEEDREALVTLYNATGGPDWKDNTNWLSGAPLGEWYGVFTDDNGRVDTLSLRNNGLTGEIPAELGNLSKLVVLRLHNSGTLRLGEPPAFNQLTGEIPRELGSLASLVEMDLRGNQLTGEIPLELANLSNLALLNLSGNRLTGEIPPELVNLSDLDTLDLSSNPLSGCIPGGLRDVDRNDLHLLGLRFCDDDTTERDALVALYNVAGGPDWKDNAGWLSDATLVGWAGVGTDRDGRVVYLDLSDNNLSGEIPPELASLIHLHTLVLSDNDLGGEIPRELGNLSNLEGLALGGNQLTGEIPPELGNLANLTSLDLSSNRLSGEIPPELGGLSNLNGLFLLGNQLTGEIPPELGALANLAILNLHANWLTGEIPPELGGLANLTSLYLSGNQLGGEIPPELGGLANLFNLRLRGNGLSGCIPGGLRDVEITDAAQAGLLFCGATDRDVLVLFYHSTNGPDWSDNTNWLSDAPLGEWHGVTTNANGRVIGLALPNNELTNLLVNEIPTAWGRGLGSLSRLERLDLRGNYLRVEIPPELGNLSNLRWLNLSFNILSGEIPPELGNLTNLEGVFLVGYDALGGCIPNAWRGVPAWDLDELGLPFCDAAAASDGGSPSGDRDALAALFGAAGGPDWEDNTKWLSDAPLGEWHGVTTDANGRVIGLDLSGNGLSGEIPPQLGDLSNLELLLLDNNQLTGEIPPELGSLTRLRELFLGGNRLSGEIPAALGRLRLLQVLGLSLNQLTGEIPPDLGNLPSLQLVLLAGNRLVGCIPARWRNVEGDVDEMGLLFCGGASDRDALVALYDATRGAEDWIDSTNWLSDAPLGEWHGVTTDADGRVIGLDLSSNQVNGEIPAALGSLSDLQALDLSDNWLSGEIPAALGSLSNLQELDLSWDRDRDRNYPGELTGAIPPELGNLSGLRRLDISHHQLSGAIPSELGSLPNLRELRLRDNRLTGDIPPELANLANLEVLSLSVNQLTGDIPPELGNLASLEELFLAGNQLTGAITRELGNLSNLRVLSLSYNQLSGAIPRELGNLSNLEGLALSYNQLAGEIPPELGSLSNLQGVFIRSNELSGCIPGAWRDVPRNDFDDPRVRLPFCE